MASKLETFYRQANQGLTLGFADEIQDMIAGAFLANETGQSYSSALKEARKVSRQELSKDAEDSPLVSLAGQVVGGIPLGFTRAGISAANWLRNGSALQGLARGAASGAGFGGIAGLASSDDTVSDRLSGAAGGAAFGGIAGGALSPLSRLGIDSGKVDYRKVVRQTEKAFSNKAEKEVARQLSARPDLREALSRAETNMASSKRTGIPLTLAEAIAQTPSDSLLAQQAKLASNPMTSGRMAELYAARSGTPQQTGAIESRLTQLANQLDPSVSSYDEAAEAIIGRANDSQRAITSYLSSVADPLYDEAFSQPTSIMNQELQRFIDTPEMKRGIGRGLNIQRLEKIAKGDKFDPMVYGIVDFDGAGNPIIGSNINTRLLDAGKRGLDAMINDETNQFGRVSDLGRALIQFKDSYLREVDRFNTVYREARDSYSSRPELLSLRDIAGSLSMIDSNDNRGLGRKLFGGTQKNADDISKILSMPRSDIQGPQNPATAAASRIYGAMDELRNDPINLAQRIAPDQRTSDQLRSYAGPMYGDIEETLNVINRAKLGERTRSGSPTASLIEADRTLENAANMAMDVATGGKTGILRRIASMFSRGDEQSDPQFYSDMADLMLTPKGMDLARRVASGQQSAVAELQQIGLPSLAAPKVSTAVSTAPVSRAGISMASTPPQEQQSPVFVPPQVDMITEMDAVLSRPSSGSMIDEMDEVLKRGY